MSAEIELPALSMSYVAPVLSWGNEGDCMIDDLTGERLTIQNGHLILAAAQRPRVDAILKEHRCPPAVWSAGISAVERYVDTSPDDMRNVAVWSVAFDESMNIDSLQVALDAE